MNVIKMMKRKSKQFQHETQLPGILSPPTLRSSLMLSPALQSVSLVLYTFKHVNSYYQHRDERSLYDHSAPLSYHYLYNKWPHFEWFIYFLLHCIVCWEAATVGSPAQMLTVCSASFAQLSLVHAGGWCAMFHPARPVGHVCVFLFFWGQEPTPAANRRTTPFLAS